MSDPRRLYLLLETLRSAALGSILPVFALYYRHFEIPIFQIAVLAAVFEATILLFEIPTGIWADRFSRRSAMIISESCLMAAGVLFFGLPGLLIFIIAEIIQGIGEAFGSGSLEGWVVDELHIGADRRATESLFAGALRWKTTAVLVGSLSAGLLGANYLRWAWLPFAALHCLALIVSLSMREHRPVAGRENELSIKNIVASGIRRLTASTTLKILVVFGIVTAFAEEGIDQFWQVYFNESLHIPVASFGLLAAIPALIVFLFAPRIIETLGRRFSPGISIASVQLFLAGGILGIALFGRFPAAMCLGAVFVLRDLKKPIIAAWANRHILSEHRAGMLSFLNLVLSVGEVGAGLVFGLLAARWGLHPVYLTAGLVSLIAVAIVMFRGAANQPEQGQRIDI